jgi:cell division protein ZapA
MKTTADGVTVSILGKELMVACPADEHESLFAAARLVDAKMRDITGSGKVVGSERAALMTALNLAYELLELKSQGSVPEDVTDYLKLIQTKIDSALAPSH